MKLIFLFIVIMLAGVLSQMSAQESVTVHVAGQSLESLLTEEQKQSVRSLTVTGTLAEADYAYLRSGLLNQLDTLNLRRAEIDTIPKLAFYCELSRKSPKRRIILPEGLKHFADSSLWVNGDGLELELTDEFPTNGKKVYNVLAGACAEIGLSSDNKKYKLVNDIIYSSDGRVLYRSNFPGGVSAILDGVHIICSNAFEGNLINGPCVVPSSVDSIGDRAFANLELFVDGSWDDDHTYIVFRSLTPPRLGTDVFLNDSHEEQFLFKLVYVPDESLDLYWGTDGWKDVVQGGADGIPLNVGPLSKDVCISVLHDGETFRLVSQKNMTMVSCYDVLGRLLCNKTVNSDEATIPKSVFNSSLVIVKVNFADGTTETLKLQL